MAQKGLNTWNFQQVVRESPNIAKWNPNLAIDWMEDVRAHIQNDVQLKSWNQSAEKINFTIDFLEKSGKVKHEEYWGHRLAESRRIKLNLTQPKGNK
jgi:hypothetical protein